MRAYKLKKLKRVHGLHFAPDGSRVLAVGGDEVGMVDAAVWLDLATGETSGRVEQFAGCYAVDPARTVLVLGAADQWEGIASVQWTALSAGGKWKKLPKPKGAGKRAPKFINVAGLAFDPTGKHLAIGYNDEETSDHPTWDYDYAESVALVEFTTGKVVTRIPVPQTPQALAFNADGTRLAMASPAHGARVYVYDLATQSERFMFEPPGSQTRCVRFLPDDRVLVANGKYVYVLPADGGKPQFALGGHAKQVNAVAVSPDDWRILTASNDGAIRTWDAKTGKAGPAFDWAIGAISAVEFAPDGLTCAAAGTNGRVVVWDVDA
jgi:WD40 repeat protein